MKIKMLLTNACNPDVRVYKEAKYLAQKGAEVEIICWDRNATANNKPSESIDGIQITRYLIPSVAGTGYKQFGSFFKFVKAVKKHLKKNEFDYVHCHDFDGVVTLWLSFGLNKKPFVFDMHEFYEVGNVMKRKAVHIMMRHILKKCRFALYENDIYLEEKGYSEFKLKYLSLKNYPSSDMIQCLPKTKSDKFRVAYHGAVRNQVKQFSALFEAVKDMSDVRVDINGKGVDYKQLCEIGKKYNNVFINGPYDGVRDTSRLYSESDVIFCGYDSSVPNYQKHSEAVKFFESIYTGTPMIGEKNIGMGEKTTKFGFGISVDTTNSDEIKKAILTLKNDHDFWNSCRENELSNAPNYLWENEVKVLDKVY